MTRRITLTVELPEEVCRVLEQRAAAAGRSLDDAVAEYLASLKRRTGSAGKADVARRKAMLERHRVVGQRRSPVGGQRPDRRRPGGTALTTDDHFEQESFARLLPPT